ncbi:hypothetical protein VITFI_CDS3204 [Vitreoscilla filiformis]|uniref:Uncharacterized protein n=1 Tax=Vitreoscilla filiformis TaxID=63 RepID=A0A221KIV7_VITFI|nr:hypothetical protein VITFI_CDS3204 [Vitreoscilla filiformis]
MTCVSTLDEPPKEGSDGKPNEPAWLLVSPPKAKLNATIQEPLCEANVRMMNSSQ